MLNRVHSLRKLCKQHPNSSIYQQCLSVAEQQLQFDILQVKADYEENLITNFAVSNDSRIYYHIRCLSGHAQLPEVTEAIFLRMLP